MILTWHQTWYYFASCTFNQWVPVCMFLTVLKHKIPLYVCTYLGNVVVSPKNSSTAIYFTLKCAFRVGMFVFVLVCVISPIASSPNSISTTQIASWKHSVLQPWKPANKLGHRSQINLKSLSTHLKISNGSISKCDINSSSINKSTH